MGHFLFQKLLVSIWLSILRLSPGYGITGSGEIGMLWLGLLLISQKNS